MKLITDILTTKKLNFKQFEIKQVIQEIIANKLKIKIIKKNIHLIKNTIIIKTNYKIKSKILLLSPEIVSELKNKFPKSNINNLK